MAKLSKRSAALDDGNQSHYVSSAFVVNSKCHPTSLQSELDLKHEHIKALVSIMSVANTGCDMENEFRYVFGLIENQLEQMEQIRAHLRSGQNREDA
jgi:hypothetical protein